MIGIDARFYGSASKGLGRYTEQLLNQLAKQDHENDYCIFLRKENWSTFVPPSPKWKKILADFPWYSWQEQLLFPSVLRKERCDVYHFPHFNVPLLAPKPFVVTVHDLILSRFPTVKATTLGPVRYAFKYLMYHLVMRYALRASAAVIAVSEYTKQDILKEYSIEPAKIFVTYEGVTHPEVARPKKNILQNYGIVEPYLLYVGNAYPHKNLEGLLRAFPDVRKIRKELSLVLVGKDDYFFQRLKQFVREQSIEKVVFPGFVPDDDLQCVYAHADAYVFPSLYEGFGLPPLEAMANGTPVVSSKASCLPEVLGSAVVYFDPRDQRDMIEALVRIGRDVSLRKELQKRGYERVQRYNWASMAEKTKSIYTKIHGS